MHLCDYMEALRREAPLEWRHKFLAYQRLKQSLEDLSVARTTRMPGEPAKTFDCHNDVSFFPQLHEEVERINREFTTAAKRLINKPGQGWLEFCLGSLVGRPGSKDLTLEEIASKAEWCVRFAVINSVALKKIVKAHDNYCSCRSANAYFQDLWCGNLRSVGSFLRSPLLDELRSLRVNLQQEAGKDSFAVDDLEVSVEISNFKGDSEIVYLPMLPALAASSAGLGGGGSLQIFPTTTSSLSGAQDKIAAPFGHQGGMQEGEDVEDPPVLSEHSCPICLEAMYQPIGLECGHKFCAQCAFNSAGKANALGSFQAILDHVSANAPCPQCRTPGAFVLAMNLKETGHLIRRRYPKAWAEAAAEAKLREERLREILKHQKQRVHHNFHMTI